MSSPPSHGPESKEPAVDVVVLTWNDGPMLDAAVASALASDRVEVQVVVVDNGSVPAPEVAADPRVSVLRNSVNRGVAAGRNQGIRAGNSPVVCLLDSDARLHPASLARLVDELWSADDVGLVGPVFDGQRAEASGGAAPTAGRKLARLYGRTDEYIGSRTGVEPAWDVDFVIGACQVFRRAACDAVSGLDERYFYGPEDVDFCLRLREAGWRVRQVENAGCAHPPRRRHRRLLSTAGARHAWAVTRFLWRHRRVLRRRSSATP